MYNPDQPRDADGRWTKVRSGGSKAWDFVGEYGDEIAIGAAIVGGAALTYGAISVATPTAALAGLSDDAAKFIINATKVRRVGPLDLSKVGKLIPPAKKFGLKTGEAWQYNKGFFSPGLADDVLTPLAKVGQPLRNMQVGAQVGMKGGTKSFGAPKPLGYDQLNFKSNPFLTRSGGIIVGTGATIGAASQLHKRKN